MAYELKSKQNTYPTQQAQIPSLQSIFIKLNIFLVAVYFLSLIALSLPPNYKWDCKEKKAKHICTLHGSLHTKSW